MKSNLEKLRELNNNPMNSHTIEQTVKAILKDWKIILEELKEIERNELIPLSFVELKIEQLLKPTDTLKKSLRSGSVF